MSQQKAKHVSQVVVHKEKWLQLSKLKYISEKNIECFWDCAERTTRKGDLDGVDIIALIKRKGEEPKIVLCIQYRPPIHCYCVEFPAGLVDEGEDAKQAALRELKEETGYTGKVIMESPLLAMEPGITNANCKIVHVEIDGDLPDNQEPKPELDENENIEVLVVPVTKLLQTLEHYSKEKGYYIDAKLYTYAYSSISLTSK